jgi:hypothetical protein
VLTEPTSLKGGEGLAAGGSVTLEALRARARARVVVERWWWTKRTSKDQP